MPSTATFQVKEYGKRNKRILFMLGGWKTKQFLYAIPAKILAWKGYHCIVYTYEPSVLSPDVARTRESFHAIQSDILQRIHTLKEQGRHEFSIFGFSLGSVIACMAADIEPSVSKVVLNTASTSVAATVWSWDNRAPGFKQSLLEQGYTLEKLEQEWYGLAPAHNIEHFNGKQVLMYLAVRDTVVPYTQGKQLAAMMRNKEIPLEIIINKRGIHVVAGILNIYRIGRYARFLDS